jgi:small-conductance mechanosensitive channel
MPLDDGCRLDQHHGVEDLWPDSIKPHPEQPVGGEELRAARALPTQNSHLVSQSNEFKFQRCTAAHPEQEQGTDSGQKCDHADDGMGSAQETLHLAGGFDFCAGTGRLVGQVTFFVALTILLLYRGIVPYDAGPSGVSVLQRVFVDFAKVVWWANAAWVCAGFVRVFLIFKRQPHEERLAQDLVVGTIYLGAALSVAANVFGVPVGTLIATSGVFAIILGLAMQSTLSDVFSGIALNIGRSYAIGDWIALSGGIEGRVVETNWRATRLINGTNDLVVVPNSDLAKARLTNMSGPDRSHGVTLTIRLMPTTRPAAIADVMRTVLLSCNSILSQPKPSVQLKSLDAQALEVELSFRAADLSIAATAQNEIFDLIYRHANATGLRLSPPFEAPGVALQLQDALTSQQPATPLSVLNGTPLFASLTEAEREALAKTMVRRTYHKDEVVVEQGAKLGSLMIVRRGALVVIYRDQQREIELNRFDSLGVFHDARSLLVPTEYAILAYGTR